MRSISRGLVAVGFFFAMANGAFGCSSSSSGSEGETAAAAGQSGGGSGGSGGGSSGSGGASGCTATGDLDMTGTWLVQVRFGVDLVTPKAGLVSLCPAMQTGEADFLAIMTMTQDGMSISNLGITVCSVALPQAKAIAGLCTDPTQAIVAQVAPTQQLLDALPSVSLAPLTATLSSTQAGAAFTPDRITYALGSMKSGADMAKWVGSVSCDDLMAMPLKGTSTTCETTCVSDCTDVVDTDSDGAPGVTMTVCGYSPDDTKNGVTCQTDDPSTPGVTLQGKAYLNFTVDPQLQGTVDSSCAMHGGVDASIVYDILGGDVHLVSGQLTIHEIISSIPQFKVDPSMSKFQAVRVDGKYGTSSLMLDPSDPKTACQIAVQQQNNAFSP